MLSFKCNSPIIPIDDTEEAKDSYQTEDNKSRCKLTSLFRLIDFKGWSNSLYNQIALRCSQSPTQFYTSPLGLNFSEMSAAKLIKLDMNGNFIHHGVTDYGYNLPGFYLQQAIFKERSDINCIVHLHECLIAGISATKQGFLPLSVEGLACSDISYYDYEGHMDGRLVENVIKALGPKNHTLILRNHGIVICGSTVEETHFFLSLFMHAAKTQLIASAIVNSVDDLIVLPLTETCLDREKIHSIYSQINANSTDNIIWNCGELEYEADMRRLDMMGFKTSYPYKKRLSGV